jgi:hypothetical protein
VPNSLDHYLTLILVNPIDDPVIPASGAVKALELEPERVPHPLRCLGERSIDELDSGETDLLR